MDHSPQLAEQWQLLAVSEYTKAFQQTLALSEGLSGADRRDAERLLGWVCYRQQQYAQASLWFKKACAGSDWADDWLNLAVSAARQGQWEWSEQAVEQVRLCQQAARYAQEPGLYLQLLAYARALSDVGEHTRVLALLDELALVYRRVGSADTTLLYVLRLPFLSSFLALAVSHFRRQDKEAEGQAWLEALGVALDKDGQRRVAKAVEELGK
jgi:tetratricopeptide (TPR) repeat protein